MASRGRRLTLFILTHTATIAQLGRVSRPIRTWWRGWESITDALDQHSSLRQQKGPSRPQLGPTGSSGVRTQDLAILSLASLTIRPRRYKSQAKQFKPMLELLSGDWWLPALFLLPISHSIGWPRHCALYGQPPHPIMYTYYYLDIMFSG